MHKKIATRIYFLLLMLVTSAFPAFALPPQAPFSGDFPVGSIIIKTQERQLLYVKGKYDIVVYPIAVGRQGRKWTGVTAVSRKVLDPKWAPPQVVRNDHPELPALINSGANNPLGAAVLVLGDGTYGIHGTNKEETIGTDASYGCFRMHNADILVLFNEVNIGAMVYVQY